jgi:predicted protein tyrosine phosphatase
LTYLDFDHLQPDPEDRRWAPPGADFDFVTDRIATGGMIWDADDVAALEAAGITHVVTAAVELEEQTRRILADRFVHLANGVHDDGLWKSPTWFRRTINFTVGALRDPDARVLLHCGAGINRGPSSAYAVLRALGHSPSNAYGLITDARPIAAVLYARDADEAIAVLGLGSGRTPDEAAARSIRDDRGRLTALSSTSDPWPMARRVAR